jgi:hypothetical protein
MLILWDHGSGWDSYYDRSTSPQVTARAIGEDNTSHSVMRIIDIPAAVRKMYSIDIIATDACLMNMLEVAYEWRNCADYLVGSEDETPGEGFPYQLLLSTLNSDAGLQMTPKQFANDMSQEIYNYWAANYLNPAGEATIDLTRLGNVASALDALSSRLLTIGSNYSTQVKDAYSTVESFGAFGDHRADLYNYAELLAAKINDDQLRSAAGSLKSAIQAAVSANMHPTNRPNVHGLSIYLPTRSDFIRDGGATSYSALELSADTQWNEWLTSQP